MKEPETELWRSLAHDIGLNQRGSQKRFSRTVGFNTSAFSRITFKTAGGTQKGLLLRKRPIGLQKLERNTSFIKIDVPLLHNQTARLA